MKNRYYFLILNLLLTLLGCTNSNNTELNEIERSISQNPREALYRLDSIDQSALSECEIYYCDFLKVKIKDKCFIKHTSDSLICNVLNHYSKNSIMNKWPELLYYAGRVYTDLGDYPTAINYFQKCIDEIADKHGYDEIKGNVLSNLGAIFNSLRLYDQAVPYMKEAINLDSILNDKTNLFYDYQLLGAIYYHADSLDNAFDIFNKSWKIAAEICPSDTVKVNMYLAGIELERKNITGALNKILYVPENIDSLYKNTALGYAAKINLAADDTVKAYQYAHELLSSHNPVNRKNGYRIILSDRLINNIPEDSIIQYIKEYRDILEADFDQNSKENSILQNTLYNYSVHQREKEKAEKRNIKLIKAVCAVSFILLISIILILIIKNSHNASILKLREALEKIESLKRNLEVENDNRNLLIDQSNENVLKEKLLEELDSILPEYSDAVSSAIMQSRPYLQIQELIFNSRPLTENSTLWIELENVILEKNPRFKDNLFIMTGGPLKEVTYRIALLIKCGFSPSSIAKLLCKTISSITYQRNQLSKKFFGTGVEVKSIDKVIRLL